MRPVSAIRGYYVVAVVPSLDVRRKRFAAFTQRATDYAKETRGWSIPRIATEANISNQTIYRWKDGNWIRPPEGEMIRAFCDALDLDPAVAFAILWPGKDSPPAPADPMPMDPRIVKLARRMQDPKATPLQKAVLRNSIDIILGISAATAEADLSAEVDSERDEGSAAG